MDKRFMLTAELFHIESLSVQCNVSEGIDSGGELPLKQIHPDCRTHFPFRDGHIVKTDFPHTFKSGSNGKSFRWVPGILNLQVCKTKSEMGAQTKN